MHEYAIKNKTKLNRIHKILDTDNTTDSRRVSEQESRAQEEP